jgi:N-acetyl-anhydromuramyl-L-alanine amidase AmpD
MDIKWVGSPYFGYPDGVHGRNGYKPIAVVLHIAEGSLAGCDAWFNSPNNTGSSTQYCVGKNGEIHQYVSEDDAAWGNGQVNKPSWPLLIQDVNPNLYTISIEHEGFTGEPWTEPMFNTDVWLVGQIIQRWNIPIDKDHIIGHYRIDSVNRARCPGTGLPWDRLFAALAAQQPTPVPVPTPPEDDQIKKLQDQIAALLAKLTSIGRLVQTHTSPQVYLLKNGTLYPIADETTLERLYSPSLVELISDADIADLPRGPQIKVD